MLKVRLGKTGLTVNKNGFGALPIQRVTPAQSAAILRMAYENGVDYFDTARSYSDSEEKIGAALSDVRSKIIIASKTPSTTAAGFWQDLETSLRFLRSDYIDVWQFHNPAVCPRPGDGTGLYEAMLKAKQQGKIRFIGFTNHRLHVAKQAVESGLYDVLQFPFSYLAGAQEKALVALCAAHDVGFVAMKGLSGGLISDAALAYNWMAQYENVLPIWGVQSEAQLNDFLVCQNKTAGLSAAQQRQIETDKAQLAGDFCRGCGYCMPCPVGIEINNCARMSLLLRRSPPAQWLTVEWQAKMEKINDCIHCRQCAKKCPYELDTPQLLQKNYEDYIGFEKAIDQP